GDWTWDALRSGSSPARGRTLSASPPGRVRRRLPFGGEGGPGACLKGLPLRVEEKGGGTHVHDRARGRGAAGARRRACVRRRPGDLLAAGGLRLAGAHREVGRGPGLARGSCEDGVAAPRRG